MLSKKLVIIFLAIMLTDVKVSIWLITLELFNFAAIIEMYGPQLIKMVEANLQPDAICGALGLCDGQKKTIPQRCQETKQVGLCRALIECKCFTAIIRL